MIVGIKKKDYKIVKINIKEEKEVVVTMNISDEKPKSGMQRNI